ncbi:20102_t:CDS:1, partial [Gigaspora margarita]
MYISNLLEFNSNSIEIVKKVLKNIQNITEINQEKQKWLPVTCNSIPYTLAQKIKKNFLWLILISDTLYEEINMLKVFVELN